MRHLLISDALALHVEHVTCSIAAATHISVRHGDNELTLNIVSAVDADSIMIVAVKLIVHGHTSVIVVLVRVFVRAEAILIILIAGLPSKSSGPSTFHLHGSAALILPLEVHDCGVFEILAANNSWACTIQLLTRAILLIRAVNSIAL